MICSSRVPGESSSMTWTKVNSGIIVISWLSSLPLSAPGGLDRASAAVCELPGVCWRIKW